MSATPGPARGVLRHADGPGRFHHARIGPRPALADVVQHIWIVRWDLRGHAAQVRETMPHPNPHLVFDADGARIHGIHTGRFTTRLSGVGEVLGIKFRPGALRPYLQHAVSGLRNRSCPIDAVFGDAARELDDSIRRERDDARRVAAIETFLLARLPVIDERVLLASRIVDGIADDRGILTVDAVLERWPMGQRALQRLFNDCVGIGVKWVINRYRLHEALARIDSGHVVDWTRLALDLGFFDQAHFIRVFHSLVGCAPMQYAGRPRGRAD